MQRNDQLKIQIPPLHLYHRQKEKKNNLKSLLGEETVAQNANLICVVYYLFNAGDICWKSEGRAAYRRESVICRGVFYFEWSVLQRSRPARNVTATCYVTL